MNSEIKYNITTDELKLDRFFVENDLEYSDEHPVETDRLKCFEATLDGALVGGACLALRQGEYILDGIAVAESCRGQNVGEHLLQLILEEVRSRGASRIYLVARAAAFFRKYGFRQVARDEAPQFFECLTCPQFGIDCNPEVMILEV